MRYLYFRIRYSQWFKSENGITGFAEQCAGWVVARFLKLAHGLLTKNSTFKKNLEVYSAELKERNSLPKFDMVAYKSIREQVIRFTIGKWILVGGEFIFNYYAFGSVIRSNEWFAVIGKVLASAFITYGIVIAYQKLFEESFNEPEYKSDIKTESERSRSWLKLAFYVFLCIGGEFIIYYLSIIRGIEIEGTAGQGTITIILVLLAMLAPILAGWFDYAKSRVIGAYKNTRRINWLNVKIAKLNEKIGENIKNLRMKFEKLIAWAYAIVAEFKIYKSNYNKKRSIENEDLNSHFAKDRETFRNEVLARLSDELEIYEIVKSQTEKPKDLPSVNNDNHKAVTAKEILLLKEAKINPNQNNTNGESSNEA